MCSARIRGSLHKEAAFSQAWAPCGPHFTHPRRLAFPCLQDYEAALDKERPAEGEEREQKDVQARMGQEGRKGRHAPLPTCLSCLLLPARLPCNWALSHTTLAF